MLQIVTAEKRAEMEEYDETQMIVCDTCRCVVEGTTEGMQRHSDWHDEVMTYSQAKIALYKSTHLNTD
jgi:hypothetical protein